MVHLFRSLSLLSMLVALVACVTINISFPPQQQKKAADKIIDEVWQLKDGEKQSASKPVQPQ